MISHLPPQSTLFPELQLLLHNSVGTFHLYVCEYSKFVFQTSPIISYLKPFLFLQSLSLLMLSQQILLLRFFLLFSWPTSHKSLCPRKAPFRPFSCLFQSLCPCFPGCSPRLHPFLLVLRSSPHWFLSFQPAHCRTLGDFSHPIVSVPLLCMPIC